MSTPTEIFTAALENLGAIGAGESAPSGEDGEVCRKTFNRLVGQWNRRLRNAQFIRQQAFLFDTSQETYSIGAAADTPDFEVASGGAPLKILAASVVYTNVSPNVEQKMRVINWDLNALITIPELSSSFPNTLYYQPTFPNGTLRPWPAFPTETAFELKLWWANQFTTVAVADVGTTLDLPQGAEEALSLTLAEKLWLKFPKRTSLEELSRQARLARADFQSNNAPPPAIDTADGVQGMYGAWNYQTRLPVGTGG